LIFMGRLALISLAIVCSISAEQAVLIVRVKDIHERAVRALQLRAEGGATCAPTDVAGIARIALSPQIKSGDRVNLQLVKPATDLVFISPWDSQVFVPSFDSAKEIMIVLANRGDRALLENGLAIMSLTENILKRVQPPQRNEPASAEQRRHEALAEISKSYGLGPEELDTAIRAWGEKTEDPYEKGITALYEKRYPEATLELQVSLAQRETALGNAQRKVVDAAFYLGQSLFEQGWYRESAAAYEKAAKFSMDDSAVLNNWAFSLAAAGDRTASEPLFRRALGLVETVFGPDHPETATLLNNLAFLLTMNADYAGAEPLFRRALVINEEVFGPDQPETASSLHNLAFLLYSKGDYAAAEPLYRRALVIREKALGPDHPETATSLDTLARLLKIKGDNAAGGPPWKRMMDYAGAEMMYRRALAIRERTFGPDHPKTALLLNDLGELLYSKRDYAGAELLYRRALSIYEKVLGPDHPETATTLNNLAFLLKAKGDYTGAETMLRRALTIKEKALGPDDTETAALLNSLAFLLNAKGDSGAAEPMYRRALAIIAVPWCVIDTE
jgi:tetratricopeptide (TPR) repeat protein